MLSVPLAAGPVTPVCTTNALGAKVPFLSVVMRVLKGLVQDTGTALPATVTFGWLGSLLHSTIVPVELATKPLPATVMLCPLLKPVLGETVMLPAANAVAGAASKPTVKQPNDNFFNAKYRFIVMPRLIVAILQLYTQKAIEKPT